MHYCTQVYMILKELDPVLKYHITNRPDNVAQLVERRASIPEIVGSISSVVRQNFQPAQCRFHPE